MTINEVAADARCRIRRSLARQVERRRPLLYGVAIHAMPATNEGEQVEEGWGCGPMLAITTLTETLPLTTQVVQAELGGQYWSVWGQVRALISLAQPFVSPDEPVDALHLTLPIALRGGAITDYTTIRTIIRPPSLMACPLVLLAMARPPGLPR